MDIKGIAFFLGLSFLLVFMLTFVLLGEGLLAFRSPSLLQYLLQMLLMGIPALAALATGLIHPANETDAKPTLWPVPKGAALRVLVLPMTLFAVAYGVATVGGLTVPQWNLAGVLNQVDGISSRPLQPHVKAIAPFIILGTYPVISMLLGGTLFAAIALGSEFGWRGYLLPRLMPLGALPAYVLGGLCWGLWFFPFIYGWHREVGELSGLLGSQMRFIATGIVLSAILGQIKHRTHHLGLCAVALGGVVAQASGIWPHLFQQASPPWTGPMGWFVIVTLGLSAFVPQLWSSKRSVVVSEIDNE